MQTGQRLAGCNPMPFPVLTRALGEKTPHSAQCPHRLACTLPTLASHLESQAHGVCHVMPSASLLAVLVYVVG